MYVCRVQMFQEKSRNNFFNDRNYLRIATTKVLYIALLNVWTILRVVPHTKFSIMSKKKIMQNNSNRPAQSKNELTITSLEIAEISNKPHADLMKSIRKQEVAWAKVNEGNFSLVKYKDKKGEERPMYLLSKMESLYITSKFNDELRAMLVKRWYDLENHKVSFGLPRNTTQGVARQPYTSEEKTVLQWVYSNLLSGDYAKIARATNLSKTNVSLVLRGKHVNSKILKESYRVALNNVLQQKKSTKNIYNKELINDCLATIKILEQ